jgi:hypothetical protein
MLMDDRIGSDMRLHGRTVVAGLLSTLAAAGSAGAQQTMICETTTITTTTYYSNGIVVTHTESVRVCWPAPQ